MKFGLFIQDLDADQASKILEQFTGNQKVALVPQPTVTASQYTNVGSGVQSGNEAEFDSAGQPWDERIHAGTKTKNSDGRWKKKKGVDEATIAAVSNETVAAKLDRVEASFAPKSPNVVAPASFAAPVGAPTVVPALAAPAALTVPNTVAAPAPAPISRDFKGLMQQLSNLFAAKSIDPTYPVTIVQRINTGFGVNIATVTDVANDPRMVEYAWQCLDVDGKAA